MTTGPDGTSGQDDGTTDPAGESTPPARPARRSRRPDLDEARRAIRRDLDSAVYARGRRRQERRRDALERDQFDPSPPGDDEWTIPDRTGLKRMPGTPEPLGDLLADLMERRGWSSRLRSSALFARWEEVVGQDVARRCEPIRLVGGVLVVAATSPSWATQLRYLSNDLQLAVNRALGEPVVESVEVQVRR